jgi:alanyl-tRNA synthetase
MSVSPSVNIESLKNEKGEEETLNEGTKRLYFEDPYQREFEAVVVKTLTYQGKPALVLDQTCFYPESGGQPADRGTINGVEVVHVLEENDHILHLIKEDVPSDRVKGKIDWERRFDHMQQHAGQHILSQSFHELLQAATRSFHLGEEVSTLEIDLRKIREEDAERVEKRANATVFEDREIKSYFIDDDEVGKIPLRRPPKKQGLLRIIEVAEYDYSACGGTHPRRTGEIGLIKILKWEKIRDNMRFEFICGRRALEDYTWKSRMLRKLSNRLTAHERDVAESVEKVFSDLKSEKRKNRKLQERLLEYEAQEIIQRAEGKIIKNIFSERSGEKVKYLALNIIRAGECVVLYGVRDERGVHLVLARSDGIDIDLRDHISELSSLIDGRGGGRPSLVEIAGKKVDSLPQAVERACRLVEERIKQD